MKVTIDTDAKTVKVIYEKLSFSEIRAQLEDVLGASNVPWENYRIMFSDEKTYSDTVQPYESYTMTPIYPPNTNNT